jgi:hypothetical protein
MHRSFRSLPRNDAGPPPLRGSYPSEAFLPWEMPSAQPAPWSPTALPYGHSAVRAPVILCRVSQLRQTASDQSRHSPTCSSRALIRTRSFKTRSFARLPNEGIHRSTEDAAASIDVFLSVAARESYTFTTRRPAFLQAGPCRFGLHRRTSNRTSQRPLRVQAV